MTASYQKNWGKHRSYSSQQYFNNKRRVLFGTRGSGSLRLEKHGRGTAVAGAVRKFLKFFQSKSVAKTVMKIGGAGVLLMAILVLAAFAYYSKDLPDPNKLNARVVTQSTKIFDRNGQLLYDIYGEVKRTLISFDEMPKYMKQATIAVEDKDFYKHGGLDYTRIITSGIKDLFTLSKSQGASTITQQYVRNAILSSREKSWSRKIKEAVLAIEIEQKYSKDEILKLYLNEIPYGSNTYGIQAAAQTYFGIDASKMDLAQCAYLAALPQSPTTLSPYGPNRQRLDDRKNLVLRLMRDQGYINDDQMKAAQSEEIAFTSVSNSNKALHFVLYIEDQLAQKYGEKTLQEGGLQITTTLDLNMQQMAQDAINQYAPSNQTKYNANNEALVAIDPATGQILAMVGSREYKDSNGGQINMAMSPRQPGSSFKPYVYATAFKQGYSPASMLMDVTTNFGNFGGQDYTPHNYTGKEYGPVSMRQALDSSLNISAVKTIMLAGVKNSIETAHDMGITTLQDESRYGPSLVLGGGEVTLLDHVSAYGTFANNGVRKPPVSILKVVDANGKILEQYQDKTGQQVLDPQIAYLMSSVLSDNSARTLVFNPHNFLVLPNRPAAAKTGTTQDFHDGWTVGYTPQLVAGVWVGNSDYTPMKGGADGSAVAAPIWNVFMQKALAGQPAKQFDRPVDIRDIAVDKVSGKLPTQYTPETKPEVFANFALPTQYDDVHIPITLDRNTMKPASASATSDQTITQVYTIFHSEKPDDPNWEIPVRNWATTHGFPYPDGYQPDQTTSTGPGQTYITLSQPAEGQTITTLPLVIEAVAASSSGVVNITFYFDGNKIFSNDSAAAKYFYSQTEPDGDHTIKVEVTDKQGSTNAITRHISYKIGAQGVTLTQPNADMVAAFPMQLAATAAPDASGVKFYFQKQTQGAPAIIPGEVIRTQNDTNTSFSLTWNAPDKPRSGTYSIFAQDSSGNISKSVTIVVQ